MNYNFKGDPKNIETYSDLMQEYLKNISTKDYLNNVNYDRPITTIEPLAPIQMNYIPTEPPYKEHIGMPKAKGRDGDNPFNQQADNESIEREKERKKKLEYQLYLDDQIKKKKERKEKEKEEEMKRELLYEQRFLQEKGSDNKARASEINKGFPSNQHQIAEELFLEHPQLKQIMQKHQLTDLVNEPEPRQQRSDLKLPGNQPLVIQHQTQQQLHSQQQQPFIDNETAQMTSSHPHLYINPYNTQQVTNMSTPILSTNTPQAYNHQLYTSTNNPFFNREALPQGSISQSSNNFPFRSGMNVGNGMNYPPILEKMLDYFFQEQVKIIRDYKETIEQLKNERDQALYLNKANDQKIQALERIKSDQIKFNHQYGFTPYDSDYNKKVEDTLTSFIEKDIPCHFKSKYEEEDEPLLTEAEGKCSMIGESKFVKQTGDKQLIETWIKEEEIEEAKHSSQAVAKDKGKCKEKLPNAGDISAITERNLCDDKSFDPAINSIEKEESKHQARDRDNSKHVMNENICYPEFYRDGEEEEESVKEILGEIMIDRDNNVKLETTNKMIININASRGGLSLLPMLKPNLLNKATLKETLRYKDDNANNENNMDMNLEFPIETSEISNVDIDNNIRIATLKKDRIERNELSSSNISDSQSNKANSRHELISIENNLSQELQPNRSNHLERTDKENNQGNESENQIKLNLNTEPNKNTKPQSTSITKEKPEKNQSKELKSPFQPIAFEEEPKLSEINPVLSSNCNSDCFKKKEDSNSQREEIESSKDQGEQGTAFPDRMTFLDESNNSYYRDSNIAKSSKHVTGNIFTAKITPQARVLPITEKNITDMNSFYEKMKKKKKERQSTESSKADGPLLDESLNTFNTNLGYDNPCTGTMNEKIIQKVQKFTQVALNQMNQSELSIFQQSQKG